MGEKGAGKAPFSYKEQKRAEDILFMPIPVSLDVSHLFTFHSSFT